MSSTTKPAEVWVLVLRLKYTWGNDTWEDSEAEVYTTLASAQERLGDIKKVARDYSCEGYITDNGIPINAEILDWHISAKKIRGPREVA